jgi:peptidoglycan hydrolase-like protein with peptidoglycan-binding domain
MAYGDRTLKPTTPHMRGSDVGHLQVRLNKLREDPRFRDLRLPAVAVDEDLGPTTAEAIEDAERLLGFPSRYLNRVATPMTLRVLNDPQFKLAGNLPKTFPPGTAHLWALRGGRKRNARRAQLRRLDAQGGPGARAADYLRLFAGLTENPPGSNRGPTVTRGAKTGGITMWERRAGMGPGAWCGAAVIGAYWYGAGVALPGSWVYVPTISDDARARRHGARTVGFASIRKGDILIFTFGGGRQHTGLALARLDDQRVLTIEGNTSPSNGGSQSNGGGVFLRTRYRANIVEGVRVG